MTETTFPLQFISRFNIIGTTVEHILNLLGSMYHVTSENDSYEYWYIEKPQRGQIRKSPIFGVTLMKDEMLKSPRYYYASLKRSRPGIVTVDNQFIAYDDLTTEIDQEILAEGVQFEDFEDVHFPAYELFIEETGPQSLWIALWVQGGLVVTDFVATALTMKLIERYPECSIGKDFTQWLKNRSSPELAVKSLTSMTHPTVSQYENVLFTLSREPFMNDNDNTDASEQLILIIPKSLKLEQAGMLIKMMSEWFSMSDLKTLSMFLDVDPENLPDDTKDNMVRELVLQANRENKIQKLWPKLWEERPHVDWSEILAS